MRSRNEKESVIASTLCEVLQKTGASLEIIMSAMFAAFKETYEDKDQMDIIRVSNGMIELNCRDLTVYFADDLQSLHRSK